MALHAKRQGKTLIDLLHDIYQKFGVYLEKLLAIKFEDSKEGKKLTARGMTKLRMNPPKNILGTDVEAIEDYQTLVKTHLKTGVTEPLSFPSSNILLVRLEDGSKLMIRPSGTEPKMKLYSGVCQKEFTSISEALKVCEARASDLLDTLEKILSE